MTSPLCWAASSNIPPSQDQVSTSRKVQGSQTKAQHSHSQVKGVPQAWLPLHSKAGSLHVLRGKSAVHTQVAELQRKIQLLGKTARKGTKNQESTVSSQPCDQALCDKGLPPVFIRVAKTGGKNSYLFMVFLISLMESFLRSEPTRLCFILSCNFNSSTTHWRGGVGGVGKEHRF